MGPQRRDKPSLKYSCSPLDRGSTEFHGFDLKGYVTTPENYKKSGTPEPRDAEILGTKELILAIGSVWDRSIRPLAALLPRSHHRFNKCPYEGSKFHCCLAEERIHAAYVIADNQNLSLNLTSSGHPNAKEGPELKKLTVLDKILLTEPSGATNSLLRMLLKHSPKIPLESQGIGGLSCIQSPIKCRKLYGWMSGAALAGPENHVHCSVEGEHEYGNSDPASFDIPMDETTAVDDIIPRRAPRSTVNDQCTVFSRAENESLALSASDSVSSSAAKDVSLTDVEVSALQIPNSEQLPDSLSSIIASGGGDHEKTGISTVPSLENTEKDEQREIISGYSESKTCMLKDSKSHYLLAKQEHAVAGAMAGIFVSLFLHPIDTIKTVVQSCRANQISLCNVSQSIVSERGLKGLYRGISTNIALSAPISALYTFTYESVKGTLLSIFAQEYQSLAHCIAGGSASVATSFVFTPSERIKQQMQVGLRYRNSWNALVGIVGNGGLCSLYAGWGAVLCRNVPHSIIKFYTYESLKQLLTPGLSNGQTNQTNTHVTLVSGGFAASTAALFTTPFDVVKTRLQTQNPGCTHQYQSVLIMLKDIARSEGLKGLYRGLVPRLFMYIMQGGLFFASYESLKQLLSLEIIPKVIVEAVQQKQKEKHDSLHHFHQEESISVCMLVN